MRLEFDEPQAAYDSGSQSARAWTEGWMKLWGYCPNCGREKLDQFPPNSPVADFSCGGCNEQFELKSKKIRFGPKVANGAYHRKMERLTASDNPNFILMQYSAQAASVMSVCVIPKHFFVPAIIEKRKPLAATARRAGWIGSNILIGQIPETGRIFLVRDGVVQPRDIVLEQWRQTLFLRDASLSSRGWLIEVMKCVETIGRHEFTLGDVYALEGHLSRIYPDNRHVKQKIRQQLQVLRDSGFLEFLGRGNYRLRQHG